MPEGHSLELAARRLRPLVGAAVTAGPLQGATIEHVEARGKHLLVRASDGRTLHAHLGLHGSVRVRAAGTGRGRHVIRTAGGDVVIAGRVEVARHPRVALGPDLLHGRFDAGEYLRRARLVDRPVCEVLLDQRVLAGIGNVVRCEALWELRQDPHALTSAVADRRLLELAAVARRLLRAGLADGRLPRRIYRRAGRPCPRCGTRVASLMTGEMPRRLYLCPGCQPRG